MWRSTRRSSGRSTFPGRCLRCSACLIEARIFLSSLARNGTGVRFWEAGSGTPPARFRAMRTWHAICSLPSRAHIEAREGRADGEPAAVGGERRGRAQGPGGGRQRGGGGEGGLGARGEG